MNRRRFLRSVGTAATAGAVAGCPSPAGDSSPAGAPAVTVGPGGRLRFVPETVTASVGAAVRWTFESPGHNVSAKPDADQKVAIPEGAEPFASYGGDDHFRVRSVGDTYEHTFDVPGEYVYVCVPHAGQGMVGTVVVEE